MIFVVGAPLVGALLFENAPINRS